MNRIQTTGIRRSRSGQAVVEFALILPVFLLLLFGAIEFGRAYFTLHLLTNAAREGARTGVVPGKVNADVSDAVDVFLQGVGLNGSWTTSVVVKDSSGTVRGAGLVDALEGDRVHVAVNYNFAVLSGQIIPGMSGTLPLAGRCVFRHE